MGKVKVLGKLTIQLIRSSNQANEVYIICFLFILLCEDNYLHVWSNDKPGNATKVIDLADGLGGVDAFHTYLLC